MSAGVRSCASHRTLAMSVSAGSGPTTPVGFAPGNEGNGDPLRKTLPFVRITAK